MVDLPVDARGTVDMYIANTIAINIDLEGSENVERLRQCILLIIQCTSRARNPNEPIPGHEMACLPKLITEAGAEEIKMILG